VKQFSRGDVPDEMPEVTLEAGEISVAELLKRCFDVSLSEARRMVSQGAVAIDEIKVDDANSVVAIHDGMILKMGKRRWAKVRI
jgi:tyrosyl-tRNA synthetase